MRASIVRSTLIAAFGTLVLAAGAAATAPVMEPFEFSYAVDFPAGTLCDFDYHEEVTVTGWNEGFIDQDGDIVRETLHLKVAVTPTNSDTGYTLTEAVTGSQTYATQTVRVVGVQWLLKDSTGRVVLAHAGQLIFDFNLEEVTKVTPNFGPDFAEEMCPALGGYPA
jgi:hypothetical protein